MKKHLYLLLSIFISYPNIGFPQFKSTLGIESQETYFRYYPSSNYVWLQSYNLSAASPAHNTKKTIEVAKKLIRKNEYCQQKFEFKFIKTGEEKIYLDRNHLTMRCDMVSTNKNVFINLKDILSGIMGRRIEVKLENQSLQAIFKGDDVVIAQNNAKGVYRKGQQMMIAWPTRAKYFEAVIRHKTKKFEKQNSLVTLFGTKEVKSPEISQKKVNNLRGDK